ncbi:MAG: type IV toxin-antitoxin system AbiEi family antitoxin domain-containing protein [Nocardioides sp.]|uniref:type IV toxin-antitoxin system AbiEi family antitoxin domain-containing protein n=1 Tax=Nocardioides sp. TaxID=35761 RepID=UPI003D6A1601
MDLDLNEMLYNGSLGETFPLPPNEPFTYKMARRAGISRRRLGELLTNGLVRRPVKGTYLATEAGDSLALRAACLKLVAPPDCIVVDRHAGWLLGAEMVLAPGEHLNLRPLSLYLPAGRGRLRNDIADSGERDIPESDVVEIGGLRVTNPLRTAWDLGRVRWTDEAIAGVSSMHRLGAYETEEFLQGIERFRGQRWVTTLRVIGPLADGRVESPPEAVLLLRCHQAGFPVTPQVEVVTAEGEFVGRLDLANEDLLAAVEYDGDDWHSSPSQRDHDQERREDVRQEGWLIEAFEKADLFTRHGDAEVRIRQLRHQALRRRGERLTG